MLEKIRRLSEKNGLQVVKAKTKEECLELVKAIEDNVEEYIIDEIADVIIMAYQLMMVMELDIDVVDRINYKIKRTEKRLGI